MMKGLPTKDRDGVQHDMHPDNSGCSGDGHYSRSQNSRKKGQEPGIAGILVDTLGLLSFNHVIR